MIDFRKLVQAGVHFGHQKSRWSPKMAPYIWGFKNNIHLIDVSKTANQMQKSAAFLRDVVADGKTILWIGTKKPAQKVIFESAQLLQMPYVNHRWIGGTLSNFSQVKKSITKLLHLEDVIARAQKFSHYTKKELNTFQKLVDRLEKNIGGIRKLTWPIGAIVVVDVYKEQAAVKEASRMGIPVIALVDTNSDPSLVNYVIPANDDAPRSIALIINYLAEAVQEGAELFKARQEEAKQEAEKKKAAKEKEVEKKKAAASKATKKTDDKVVDIEKKKVSVPVSSQELKPADKSVTSKKTTTKKAIPKPSKTAKDAVETTKK